jgi:uncharacterized protein YegP (UPF0339 family)
MWRQFTHLVMTRGLSSVGRALPLQGRGQGFESPRLHKSKCSSGGIQGPSSSLSRTAGRRRSDVRPAVFFGEPSRGSVSAVRGNEQFRFHLKAANGEIIAASQGYETRASAEKGIESVKTSAPDARVVDLSEREAGHN